ncbi:Metallo-dependent phosphatase-like protein [Rhodotorula diobovata]|uniref:Metallo-dependent phosphatase-like protein n=1 Tax=Rhodotorula diobovata TaxID=5288 RepID=A0A5C5FQH3_9BASI|nr:Metallo-dependent phosphatase-like protein [Rhodotorula diobovata]
MPPARAPSSRPLLVVTLLLVAALWYLSGSPPASRAAPLKDAATAERKRAAVPSQPALVNQAAHKAAPPPLDDDRSALSDRRSTVLTQRIVAVGDIHGDLPALTSILRRAGLVDLKGQWTGGDTILVQTGDIVDRGPDTIALYRFFQSLRPQAEKAGGALVSLLGNHDIMQTLGDWRYVTKEDIASFGGERNRREAFSTGWIGAEFRANYSITARVPYLVSSLPHDLAAPVLPSTPRGSSDRRFLGDPSYPASASPPNPFLHAAASFVHGGITPEYLDSLHSSHPINDMNRIGRELLFSLLDVPGGVPLSLPRSAPPEQREFWSERGPMWNRDWAIEDEDEICERVERVCEALKVRRLVMGHTPQFEGILSRCDGKVLLIDTGISRAYGGAHSSLSLTYTLTPASSLPLADALALSLVSLSDPDPEATLRGEGELARTWVETEVVEALYTRGRESETLGKWERVVVVPE